jgi:hypothetical protein
MIVRRMVKPMTVYTENSVRIDHVTESPNVSSASVIYRTSSMPDFGLHDHTGDRTGGGDLGAVPHRLS